MVKSIFDAESSHNRTELPITHLQEGALVRQNPEGMHDER